MKYMKKLICRLQRKVITKVTSLPNHSTGRKSNKPIRSRENASSCTCCFMYLKCFYRKEGRSHGWEDNRRTLFTIYINMLTLLKLRRQHTKGPLAGINHHHTCKHGVYGICDDGLLTILKIGYSLTSVINMSVSRAHGFQLITGSGTFLGGM